MFVVHYDNNKPEGRGRICGYVLKHGGWNSFVPDPRNASRYPTKDAAEAGKVGHHRDMGGSGFKGHIVPFATALASYKARRRRDYW